MYYERRARFKAWLQGWVLSFGLLVAVMAQAQDLPLPENDAARAALGHLLGDLSALDRDFASGSLREGRVHRVRPGETLDMIIDRSALAPLPLRRSILRQAFVAANPHAFRRGSPHFLFANVDLRHPGPEHLRSVVFTDAQAAQDLEGPNSRRRTHWIRYP